MFDTHAHYEDEAFSADRDVLLKKLFTEDGVTGIVDVGCSPEGCRQAIAIAESYDRIWASVGYHPEFASIVDTAWLKELLKHPKVVAIGEIGLDYHEGEPPREVQKDAFRKQMELARETGYPVIIHDRDAHGDCLEIVQEFPDVHGVFHSFSGSVEMAEQLLRLGWYLSFSGVVTFKNARHSVEVAAMVPEDRLLTETDCPFLTAVPFRGTRNDSSKMAYTIQKLAEIRGVTVEHITEITEANARAFYRIQG